MEQISLSYNTLIQVIYLSTINRSTIAVVYFIATSGARNSRKGEYPSPWLDPNR